MNHQQESYRMLRWMSGNVEAAQLCEQLMFLVHLWDDIVDGDNERSDMDVNLAFTAALVDLPSNPFYRRHIDQILPLISSGIVSWVAATAMERGDLLVEVTESGLRAEREIAYGLRCSILHVVVCCARICGADPVQITAEVWRAGMSEGLESYLMEFDNA